MKEYRLKKGFEQPGNSNIEHFKFKGDHIANHFDGFDEMDYMDYNVYVGETSKILVHIKRKIKTDNGIRYERKTYETKEDFFSADPTYPKELIDKVKLHFHIDEAEEIEL